MFRLLIFKYKIEKTSFSEKFNFTVMLPTVKYLVCLFFGYWIEEIDVWVKRITHTKKNIRSKRVKKQVLLVLDWVRSYIQKLSLLTKNQYKKIQFPYLRVWNLIGIELLASYCRCLAFAYFWLISLWICLKSFEKWCRKK